MPGPCLDIATLLGYFSISSQYLAPTTQYHHFQKYLPGFATSARSMSQYRHIFGGTSQYHHISCATSQYQSIWALYYPDSIQERMPSQNHSYPAATVDAHVPGRCTESPHSGPAMTRIAMFGVIMLRISHFLRSSVTGPQKVCSYLRLLSRYLIIIWGLPLN